MKKFSLLLVFIFVLKLSWSQNPNLDFKYAIKVYNLTTYEERSNALNFSTQSSKSLQILHPTIAFQWTTGKKNNHELELTNFSLGSLETKTEITDTTNNTNKTTDNDITSTSISVRYEYIINFSKNADKKIVPAIGFAANPYFTKINSEPKATHQFPYSEIFIGTKLFVVPRLSFFITSRFFLDLNIPICVSDIYYSSYTNENPALEKEEQTTSAINVDIFPMLFSGRIGVGIKL